MLTDPHESIHRGYLALLRAQRDDIDAAIRALERLEQTRITLARFDADPPEPERDRIADGRPSRLRRIMQQEPAREWTAQDMGAALQAEGHDLDLVGPVLNRRIAATFASMGDVERTARGRYRLVRKVGAKANGVSGAADSATRRRDEASG